MSTWQTGFNLRVNGELYCVWLINEAKTEITWVIYRPLAYEGFFGNSWLSGEYASPPVTTRLVLSGSFHFNVYIDNIPGLARVVFTSGGVMAISHSPYVLGNK